MIKGMLKKFHNLCEKLKTSDAQWQLMKKCERAINKGMRIDSNHKYNRVQSRASVTIETLESSTYVLSLNPRKILEEMGIEFTVPVKFVLEGETEE